MTIKKKEHLQYLHKTLKLDLKKKKSNEVYLPKGHITWGDGKL